MNMDGVTLVSLIVIASFAIERVVKGLLFGLSFVKPWERLFPDPKLIEGSIEQAKARNKEKAVYFLFAGILGIGVMAYFGNIRLLHAVGIETTEAFDVILTGLVLVGGSDRIAELLKMQGAPGVAKPEPGPLEVTGTLTLEGGDLPETKASSGRRRKGAE